MDNVELIARIAARAHGPDAIIHVRGVDVIIHHDGPAVAVGTGMTMRRHHACLLGMSAVKLLEGYRQHETASPGFVRPDACHSRDAGSFQLVPDGTASVDAQ